MNIIFVVARDNDENFLNYFVPSARRFNVPCYQIGDKPESDGTIHKKSINEKYHIITKTLLDNNVITDDTVIVYIHEDVTILDNLFIDKINMIFSEKPYVGVLGVIGAKLIPENNWWLNKENDIVGHIVESVEGKNITEGQHTIYGAICYSDDCVAIEGCMFAVRGSLIKSGVNFDIDTYKDDKDIYAMDLCIQSLNNGYSIAVGDILIYHKSHRVKNISDSWKISKAKFNEKYKDLSFPIMRDNFTHKNVKRIEIMDIEL